MKTLSQKIAEDVLNDQAREADKQAELQAQQRMMGASRTFGKDRKRANVGKVAPRHKARIQKSRARLWKRTVRKLKNSGVKVTIS